MSMTEEKIGAFLEELASSKPVPGGGGASALAAALGAALSDMVLHLTEGKKKYAQYQEEILLLEKELGPLIKTLSEGMDRDAEAFEPLSRAYSLPKETPEEEEQRQRVMEEALITASEAPLSLMEDILKASKITLRVSEIGSSLAISDAGAAAQLLRAAMKAASLNVFINTGLMKNRDRAGDMDRRAEDLINENEDLCLKAYDNVLKRIGKAGR